LAPLQQGCSWPLADASTPKTIDTPEADPPRQDNGGAEIVSLDAFRKK